MDDRPGKPRFCPDCGYALILHKPGYPHPTADAPPTMPPEDLTPFQNCRQVGGAHYVNMRIQTWDYITANGIPYMEGCVIKYVTRWRQKGGIQDLKKAIHYLEKLIEMNKDSPGATDKGA